MHLQSVWLLSGLLAWGGCSMHHGQDQVQNPSGEKPAGILSAGTTPDASSSPTYVAGGPPGMMPASVQAAVLRLGDDDPETLVATAPDGLGRGHLGAVYSARFERLVGAEGKSLFPEAKRVPHATVNFWRRMLIRIENSEQLNAEAGLVIKAFGLGANYEKAKAKRFLIYRVVAISNVHEVDDTTAPRVVSSPNAAYYVRRIYYGRSFEIVVSGESEAMNGALKAGFLGFGAKVSKLKQYQRVDVQSRGRGLKPTGELLFADNLDDVRNAYREDEKMGPEVPILVEYRRIPKAVLPQREEYPWEEDRGIPSIAVTWVQVDARNSDWTPSGIDLEPGSVVLVMAQGRIDISGRATLRDPDLPVGSGGMDVKVGIAFERAYQHNLYIRASANTSGPVKFRVRDSKWSDNLGSYTVRLIHIPAGLLPASADACPEEVCGPALDPVP